MNHWMDHHQQRDQWNRGGPPRHTTTTTNHHHHCHRQLHRHNHREVIHGHIDHYHHYHFHPPPRIINSTLAMKKAVSVTKMNHSNSTKHLKMRRNQQSLSSLPANLQDLDDIEQCCLPNSASTSSSSLDLTVHDVDDIIVTSNTASFDKKDDDYKSTASNQRLSAEFLLSDLSPLSRRIVLFVTQPMTSSKSLPDRCTSEAFTIAAARILPSLFILLALPLCMWDSYPEEWSAWNLYPLIRHVEMVWASLLHTSAWPIVLGTFMIAAIMPRGGLGASSSSKYLPPISKGGSVAIMDKVSSALSALLSNITQSNWKISLVLSIIFCSLVIVNMTLQMGYPHAIWNPFMWGWYTVYLPANISSALQGACLNFEKDSASRRPLCLSEQQWKELSSGQLSSYNPDDVLTVQRGLNYLQNSSGGLIINALARNVAENIPALRQNMEGLLPFFADGNSMKKPLSLVIFENDSNDGTRQAFQTWSEEESNREDGSRYTVDLMSCGPKNPNCELGIMDRYDNMNLFTNPTASGVGKLGEFRQILLEYILDKKEYNDYSHMIILDADLGTSLSPLGLLHTLGLENNIAQDHVVASSSSQVWPGTMGTIIPPYDLSAFRPKESKFNQKVREMHQSFCELMPAGDRWRNMCEACSPMQLFMIQSANDVSTHHEQPYEVVSAFNGLTLYPMNLIRQRGSQARYDAGDDGQRCEHVGFHLSLQKPMFVNPKWSMNLKPNKPGGPTGLRAIKTLVYAVFGRPNVMLCLIIGNLVFFYILVSACWMIGTSVKRLLLLLSLPSSTSSMMEKRHSLENMATSIKLMDRERSSCSLYEFSGIDTREM